MIINNFISKISSKFSLNSIKDYKNSNYYYNNFKLFENENGIVQQTSGLISIEKMVKNTFQLIEFKIETDILDSCVNSNWCQTYINNSNIPIEAIYKIPISPTSTINSFSISFKDKILNGNIKEFSKAKQIYSDSISQGHQSILAEKSNDGYLNLQIGNLPPNEKIIINLNIISEIGLHLNSLHYCIHKSIFPQQVLEEQQQQSNFKFNLIINIKLLNEIKSIYFDNDSLFSNEIIEYENQEKKNAKLTYSSIGGIKSNLVIIIEPKDLIDKPNTFIEYNPFDKSFAFSFNFYPPKFENINKEDINQKSEFIFLIDCSGSMTGEPIKKAKRTLDILIRSLNDQCKFNIYLFGTSFKKAFTESRLFNDDSLNEINQFIDNIKSDLGGTDLLKPIKDILLSKVDQSYPRQLFILTDGSIEERDELIDFVYKESNNIRIFTFGIGNSVDHDLVIGLSKATKGYYEIIKDNNNMENQVMKLLSIAFEPIISNITFDFNSIKNSFPNCNLIQAPSNIRPIYNNERMIFNVLLYLNNSNNENEDVMNFTSNPFKVLMNCNNPFGNELSYSLDLDLSKFNSKSKNIHTLSAFKYIQDLEDKERKLSSENYKDEIISIGKKYNLVSKYTSFVVTFESDQETQDTMELVYITKLPKENPIVLSDRVHSFSMKWNSSPPSSASTSSSTTTPKFSGFGYGSSNQNSNNNEILLKNDPLILIIKSQKANGSWTKQSIGRQFDLAIDKIPNELLNLEEVWVTLLVISRIIKLYSNQKSQWEFVVQKSNKWVKQQLISNLKCKDSNIEYNKYLSLAKLNI